MEIYYTTQEAIDNLRKGFHKYTSKQIAEDESMKIMFDRTATKFANVDMIEMAEAFLHIFDEREDYELCAKILKKYPELNPEWHETPKP